MVKFVLSRFPGFPAMHDREMDEIYTYIRIHMWVRTGDGVPKMVLGRC